MSNLKRVVVRSHFTLLILGFLFSYPAAAVTFNTSFEFSNSGTFSVGEEPFTATFSGGRAQTVGIFAYYHSGRFSWHVPGDGMAAVSFETPADSIDFWFRDTASVAGNVGGSVGAYAAEDSGAYRIYDTDNTIIASGSGSQSFANVQVKRTESETRIARLEFDGAGDSDSVVDDFSYTATETAPDVPPVGAVEGGVWALADTNGDNATDLGVLLRDPDTGDNKLHVMDTATGNNVTSVSYGSELARGATTVLDANGDLIPEFAVLLEGSLFARVKNVVQDTLLGEPKFNARFDPIAFLSVGETGGDLGPDVAVVGREASTGKVKAQIQDVTSGDRVSRFGFRKNFVPFGAVAIDNVSGSDAMEIAVLGVDSKGRVQAEVKDALTGNLINKIKFNKRFTPLAFSAVHDASGSLTYIAVLGRKASGVIQAQVKRVSDGTLVNKIKFSKNFEPKTFISFADSNGSGGGEIAVIGVSGAGRVRAQIKEITDGAAVNLINFGSKFQPVDAIAVNGVAGTARNEIVILGQNTKGQKRLQINDVLTGDTVKTFPVP